MASNPQGRPGQLPSPPSANSPLSPASGSNNPISFRPNVNRAKTKRWVEAKQYSYDGGDWGDEDDEEEEEEPQPPTVPRPPYANRAGSSSELSSRRLSSLALGAEESRRSPSVDTRKDSSGGDSKTLPFVRPADIYKRMRDETTSPESPGSAAHPEALPNSMQANATSQVAPVGRDGFSKSEVTSSGAGQEAAAPGLPEVKRISAFGTDFLGSGDSSSQQHASPESAQTSLHHNPSQASQGFTSVVHQAFDVPETPNSTTGSVARSNSDGTSLISPIMSNRGPQDDKTPTIPEEPAESSTPTGNGAAPKDGPVFIPGHRRDMSLPESDNSPSKKPIITDHESPPAGQAGLSAVSRANSNDKDFVAPLKFGSHSSTGPEGYRGEIPTIVPTSAGNSPEDTDNDRLREEIMRSLSRENSQEPEVSPSQPPTEGSKEESIPHQYEKYWEGASGSASGETPKALVSESHPEWASPHPLASRDPYVGVQAAGSETQAAVDTPKPKLGRRFSWESSGSVDDPSSQIPGSYASPPPLSTTLAKKEPEPISEEAAPEYTSKELPVSDSESSDGPRVEKPRLSIVPPIPENSSPPQQIMGPVDAPESPKEAPLPSNVGVLSLDDTKLKGFRDILNMTLPNERIRAFDQTRDQFAALDTGLNHWLQVTINENPDHFDLIQQSRSLASGFPRPSPSRSKFPKLGPLGNLAPSKEDSTPTSATHIRRPSGHLGTIVNRQNVGERGKEFLHTAGAFGGKAGEAAKGLFAKGRSKFRPSGGTDKGQLTTARKSLHFSFTSESNVSHANTSVRNSVNLGNLPMFKFGTSKSSTAKEQGDSREERSGKRFKLEEPMNHDTNLDAARRQSGGFVGESDFAGDLEQEMNAALGLSPTEARSKQPVRAQPVMSQIATVQSSQPPPPPSKDGITAKCSDCSPAGERSRTEKDLPPPPEEHSEIPPASTAQLSTTPGMEVSQATSTSIRPVDDDEKPPLPPKDLPPKESPKNVPLKDRAQPQASHTRQPSVSTLGVDEHANHSAGDIEDPPSPLLPPQEPESDDPHDKPLPPAKDSGVFSSSIEEQVPGFRPVYPPKTASSAQILESKRRSISALPPSTPGIHSPLRNEVRYSPGTRSSMLSFGSFGRQSTGTRPVTPANGLTQRRGSATPSLDNGDSTMNRLKSFGKRRRASVGDILSGIHGGIQGGLQGLQHGGQNKDHQKKRTFSRISGFFNRSQESQDLERDSHANVRTSSQDLSRKIPSNTSSNGSKQSMSSEAKALPSPPVPGLASSLPPVSVDMAPSARASHRASMPLPATSSGGSRFYSQLQPASTPSPAQHTRVKSQPMLGNEPLSPIAPSVSGHSGSPPLSDNVHELDEPEKEASEKSATSHEPQGKQSSESNPANQPQSEKEEQGQSGQSEDQTTNQSRKSHESDKQSSSPVHPSPSVRSRKPVESDPAKDETSTPRNTTVSNSSTLSEHPHPHRNEARVLNETTEPVELALTKDDSSEELVMSPTTYPGQEWTPPMHL